MDHSQQPASPKQSCDTCRRRKVKCNRKFPCDRCQSLLLSCSYSDVLRRKGPKVRNFYPLAPIAPSSNAVPNGVYSGSARVMSPQSFPVDSSVSSSFPIPENGYTPRDRYGSTAAPGSSSPDSFDLTSEYAGHPILPRDPRLSPYILLAHVNVYLKYLFPIMPVVKAEELRSDSQQPEQLSPSRYAFLASLCAATHIQLKLDGDSPIPDPAKLQSLGGGHSLVSGEDLLREAERARRECNPVDNISIQGLLTSFFLFASYGNMDNQNSAWFYLCQAISMAFALGLHREPTYAELPSDDAEDRRRVFWLLFITERGYALQQSKPVMLRSSIHKPQVLCSEDPILAYGFINLITIFETLTPDLYDWLSAGGSEGLLERPSMSKIQSSLANSISLEGVIEIQQVDILITQQWLQAMMWRFSINNSTQPASHHNELLPFHLPVLVGKAVMGVVGAASQGAVDAHGIGMEQKLFDLGSSVADVTRSLGTKAIERLAESTIDPRQLLWGIMCTLSQIRGSPSYLFPSLVERCKTIVNIDGTLGVGSSLPTLGFTPPHSSSRVVSQGYIVSSLENAENTTEFENDHREVPQLSTGNFPRLGIGFHGSMPS